MNNMRMTLLEMTQAILSNMNSDEVNSISDTSESLQVANCIKESYFNMLGRYDLPEHNQFFNLVGSDDLTTPVLMYKPDGVTRLEWVRYFDTNPADGSKFQQSQFGAYSTQHGTNVDLSSNSSGSNWNLSSVSSLAIQPGNAIFTVASGSTGPLLGQTVFAVPNSQPNFFMYGTVLAFSGTSLTINVTSANGTGTFNSWTISNQNAALASPGYKHVEMLSVEDYVRMNSSMVSSEADTQSFVLKVNENTTGVPNVFTFYYKNDKQPQFCCIVGNYYIIFDSYDNTQDSTLQGSKSMCFGWVYPTFQMNDNFVPNLDAQQFPLLLNDAKALAFYEIKNQPHARAEQEVSRQVVSLQKWKAIANKPSYFDELPDFGRPGWTGSGTRQSWR